MPAVRTLVTELATGLGMLRIEDARALLGSPPAQLNGVRDEDWRRLVRAARSRTHADHFTSGLENGAAFFRSRQALARRKARSIEWAGGHRAIGDETVPVDLRVDHVYLVSCKYLSHVLHNRSPAQLVYGLLGTGSRPNEADWFNKVAPTRYLALYGAVRRSLGVRGLPVDPDALTTDQRRALAVHLRSGWDDRCADLYQELCGRVATRTAELWRRNSDALGLERMLWRLLRIGPAPYFVLGSDRDGSMRLRIDTPWDWRQRYRFRGLEIRKQTGGQARVGWCASARDLRDGTDVDVVGHVEVRWSHGRFGQPPEAKVYLDTPHHAVPGYNPL